MGTRCLVTVTDGNKEILCLYRQFDGYPEGMGADLPKFAKGFKIVNGIGDREAKKTANGMGCFAAQLVAHFKTEIGNVYLYAPESREVGEEFIYTLQERDGKLHLTVTEGDVAFFGMKGSDKEDFKALFSGPLDKFNPKNCQADAENH